MQYNTLAIVGSQWGDEGKGKLTDYFAQNSDVVVRWSGGDNAGHTIIYGERKLKLSILPSGILNKKCLNIIASGCVINLDKLINELSVINSAELETPLLRISDRAHLIFQYHLKIDECQEAMRKKFSKYIIGTTKRGIGPAYQDKAERIGLRVCDLKDQNTFKEKLEKNLKLKNLFLDRIYKTNKIHHIDINWNKWYPAIKKYICDTSSLLEEEILKGKKVLIEGAQGAMLDLDYGTYPYVTSSTPASIGAGLGVSAGLIKNILGVAKAYTTRVGSGSFPSEIKDIHLAEIIREKGGEYGTVSLRPRRIGWFDLVAFNHTRRVAGFTHLAITLLDVLSGQETIKICVGYILNNEEINYVPASIEEYEQCQPIYIELPGWQEELSSVTNYEQLPKNAKAYVDKIEELTKVKVAIISVGPDRAQTIVKNLGKDNLVIEI